MSVITQETNSSAFKKLYKKLISNKTGKEYQYQKALLVLKGKALRSMMKQFLEGGKTDLTHYTMDIERDTDTKSVACGEYFTLGKKLSVPALETLAKKIDVDPKEYLKPYDYMTILAPKTDSELCVIAGIKKPMGSDESTDLDELEELGLDVGEAAAEADVFEEMEEEEEGNLELAGLHEDEDEVEAGPPKKEKSKKKLSVVSSPSTDDLI